MQPRVNAGRIAAIAVGAGLALLLVASTALGATPKKSARYTGATSDGVALTVDVNRRRNISFADTDALTSRCGPRLGTIEAYGFGADIDVKGNGAFKQIYTSAGTNSEGYVVDGRRQILLEIEKNYITGTFVTPRKVSGTWRVRTVLYFDGLFPDNITPVDVCDTGVVNWTARLRRR